MLRQKVDLRVPCAPTSRGEDVYKRQHIIKRLPVSFYTIIKQTVSSQTLPLIGISTDISPKRTAVNTAYVQSVILSGGIPYMIPVTDNVEIPVSYTHLNGI